MWSATARRHQLPVHWLSLTSSGKRGRRCSPTYGLVSSLYPALPPGKMGGKVPGASTVLLGGTRSRWAVEGGGVTGQDKLTLDDVFLSERRLMGL